MSIFSNCSPHSLTYEYILELFTSLFNSPFSFRTELDREWTAVSEESSAAKDDVQRKLGQLAQFQESSGELSEWLEGLRGKVDQYDPNQVSVPAALEDDMRSIKVSWGGCVCVCVCVGV